MKIHLFILFFYFALLSNMYSTSNIIDGSFSYGTMKGMLSFNSEDNRLLSDVKFNNYSLIYFRKIYSIYLGVSFSKFKKIQDKISYINYTPSVISSDKKADYGEYSVNFVHSNKANIEVRYYFLEDEQLKLFIGAGLGIINNKGDINIKNTYHTERDVTVIKYEEYHVDDTLTGDINDLCPAGHTFETATMGDLIFVTSDGYCYNYYSYTKVDTNTQGHQAQFSKVTMAGELYMGGSVLIYSNLWRGYKLSVLNDSFVEIQEQYKVNNKDLLFTMRMKNIYISNSVFLEYFF